MNHHNTPKPADERKAQQRSVPHNIEVLIKKASVDPAFRQLLLDKRVEAAQEIDLDLSQAEADMLSVIPREQLEKIIQSTKVPPEQKEIFSSSFGKIMLAVVIAAAITPIFVGSLGHTLTPKQREHILRQQELLKAELKRSMDPNDANTVESNSEEIEEEQK